MKYVTPQDAVSLVKSDSRIYVHGMAAAPTTLIEALAERADELRNVEIAHLHIEGSASYMAPGLERSFRHSALFVGPSARGAVNEGRADYIPVFLSEIPALFRNRVLPLDAALVQLSPPDAHGYCSLGTSVEATMAAIQSALVVIAEINHRMPRSHGDGFVHVNRLAAAVETDRPIPEHRPRSIGEVEQAIGKNVADLIEDGATIQMGIGGIPDAVLKALHGHRNLGVHSEMFSDGLVDLVESGAVNGSQKRVHPGKIVATFVLGSQRLYDFIDDNPQVAMLDVAYVNDTAVIRRNPKATAINSAIEVDLTGQVCADSIGTRMYSGVGGQMDFIRGASLSQGGRPIIALPSRTGRGESRIVPILKPGAGVVTTRAHVHYVVTEHGVANLYGRNLRQRAKSLIEIAHPDDRERLAREACDLHGFQVC